MAGVNYQNEKIKASVKVTGYDGDKRSVEKYNIIGQNSSVSKDDRRDMNDGLGLNANFDYSLSKNSNIGLVYDITKGHTNMDINSTQSYFTDGTSTLQTETDSKHRSPLLPKCLISILIKNWVNINLVSDLIIMEICPILKLILQQKILPLMPLRLLEIALR